MPMNVVSRRPTAMLVCGLLLFALLVAGLAYLSGPGGPAVYPTATSYVVRDCGRLNHFGSEAEIEEYLAAEEQMWQSYRGGPMWGDVALGGVRPGSAGSDYSGTNVQVAGVDEADLVKTDGTYIYTISGGEVVIARAYPPSEAGVVSRIATSASALFIDGTRLTVLFEDYSWDPTYPYRRGARTGVKVYEVSDPSSPVLVRNVTVDGSRVGARLAEGVVYVVASGYVYAYEDSVILPRIRDGGQERVLTPPEIGFFDDGPYGGGLTTILAVDPHGTGSSVSSFLTGYVGTLYVSTNAIYTSGFVIRHSAIPENSWVERTAIQQIVFDGLGTEYACTAEVPGYVMDQWSLDEHEGYLRVATTSARWGAGDAGSGVYVFDESLNYLGSVENLAPGETLHSVRFVGDRAYVVTFMKIDPLFVIDLSNPSNPKLLGQLHIPGFSDYLHPFGPDHLVGVGKDTRLGEGGEFSWFQGVKLSLFDVSDPLDPRESAKVVIGDRGTESEVLWDHKAFLFHAQRNLFVLPVDLAIIDPSEWPDPTPDWAYGNLVWQGVIVYSVSVDGGFTEVGRISHGAIDGETYESSLFVRRSLYIEDVLYTISDGLLRMNDLATLFPIRDVPL